jgi:hypothetical protein
LVEWTYICIRTPTCPFTPMCKLEPMKPYLDDVGALEIDDGGSEMHGPLLTLLDGNAYFYSFYTTLFDDSTIPFFPASFINTNLTDYLASSSNK